MLIEKDKLLDQHFSFQVTVKADKYAEVNSVRDIQSLVTQHDIDNPLILGGGSNILPKGKISRLVIKNNINGIKTIQESDEDILIEVGGGEVWHDLVLWAVDQGYGGIENLSLIPGTVGAAPIQNIGAYGVEVKDVLHMVWAVNLKTANVEAFHRIECGFGYRDSIFKSKVKGQYFISSVVLRLTKQNHKINTSYGAIEDKLADLKIDKTIANISQAVIDIRQSKLPDPAVIGNSGSFFKNPVIDEVSFNQIKTLHPNIPSYPAPNNQIKVPAGWLIEQAGWKGKRVGNVSCYKHQALVIINEGGATGEEVYAHALNVQASVKSKFGIDLEMEVNIVG